MYQQTEPVAAQPAPEPKRRISRAARRRVHARERRVRRTRTQFLPQPRW
ncbi:hypothetical protein [Kribbella voronezhensis]|nr:hypothetical protein [Kribbella voronezhensis]